jgi:hypothetical protein
MPASASNRHLLTALTRPVGRQIPSRGAASLQLMFRKSKFRKSKPEFPSATFLPYEPKIAMAPHRGADIAVALVRT